MSELNFTVDKNHCIKCGLCSKDCFANIIKFDKDGYPYADKSAEANCLKCQHCLAICPKGAISVFGKSSDYSEPIRTGINQYDMLNLIKNRRSCRHFKHENISIEKMNTLKDMLNYVPTGCNYRGLSYSIVENVAKMDEIKNLVYKKLKTLIKFVPAIGIIKKIKKPIANGVDVIFRNAPHMIVVSVDKKAPCAAQDPIIALSYFELYAQTLGLGTLWCGFANGTLPLSKEAMKMLNIPKNYKMAYVMMFGEPTVNYSRSIQPEAEKYSIIK